MPRSVMFYEMVLALRETTKNNAAHISLTPGKVPRLLVSRILHRIFHQYPFLRLFRSSEVQSGCMGYSVFMDKVTAVHNIIPADKY